MKIQNLKKIAKEISLLTLETSYKSGSGHLGSALSVSDIFSTLYFNHLKISKNNYRDDNRDYFILSKGHSVLSLYVTLFKKGIVSKKKLNTFFKNDGLCPHPVRGNPGIEMTSGSLGHGLAYGVGVAYGILLNKKRNRVVVLISDGECDEGSIWEAGLLAPQLKLINLCLLVDYNNWQCFGKTSDVVKLDPILKKWQSFGWKGEVINGHNLSEISKSLKNSVNNGPYVVICKTKAGKGVDQIENKQIAHYQVLNKEEYEKAKNDLKKV